MCIYVYIHTNIHVYIYTYIHTHNMHTHAYIHAYIHTYMCVCVYICMYVELILYALNNNLYNIIFRCFPHVQHINFKFKFKLIIMHVSTERLTIYYWLCQVLNSDQVTFQINFVEWLGTFFQIPSKSHHNARKRSKKEKYVKSLCRYIVVLLSFPNSC